MQSPPRALQKRLTLHRDALYLVYARNPFTMRTYEKCARKSFRVRIYETRTGVNFFFY